MEPWLQSATGYIRSWIEFQLRVSQHPGGIVAIAHRGKVIAEYAFGHANLATGEKLTPRHQFRIASHSKSFTSAGIMKLRERASVAARRSGRAICQRAASASRRNHSRASALAQRRPHPRRRRCRAVHRPQALSERQGADGRAAIGAGHRPQHPLQIFQPWLRAARSGDRSNYPGAVSGLDRTRDRRCRRFARDHRRHAARQKPAVCARPYAADSNRPAPRRARRQCDPCDHAGGRASSAPRRDVARFFAQLAPNAKRSPAFRRQPPRDDPEAPAQPACQHRGALRSWNHERRAGRLGLGSAIPADSRVTSRAPPSSPPTISPSPS